MKPFLVLVTLAAVALSGCVHVAGSDGPPSPFAPSETYYATQVVVGPCAKDAESAVLTAVASAVVAQGVNKIGEIIKAAAEKDTQVVVTRRNIEIAKGKGLGPCITIARGWFYRSMPDFNNPVFSKTQGSVWPYQDQPFRMWQAGLFLAATPDFYFQGRVIASRDGSSYTIYPLIATLDRPIATSPFRPGNWRNVLVSVALTEVGKGVDLQKGGGTTLQLGPMEPGMLLEFKDPDCIYPAVKGQAPVFDQGCRNEEAFTLLNRSAFESEWFSVVLTDKPKAMNLQALVSETRDASQFLAFVGAVFSDSKGAITKELQESLIPAVGDAADETEQAALEKALNDYDTAYGKAVADLKACELAPADTAKRTAARIAVRNLVQAGRKADKQPGVTGEDAESIRPTGTTADSCSAVLGKLK